MLRRDHWQRRVAELDAREDAWEINRILALHEFPWDISQALSFALFRTFAVPSIGRLLHETGEFTGRTQKRYDDTALLLDEVLQHGLAVGRGRDAVRRINQMHRAYDIAEDDLRYVLATFVVTPPRWLAAHGYRSLTDHETAAATHYYRELGRHMGIRALPEDFAGFERLLEDYERAHFAFDARARAVADATLDLMTTFGLNRLAPAPLVRRLAYCLMDEHLLDAFGYPRPRAWERRLAHGLLRLRATAVARMPARRRPRTTADLSWVRSYPGGHEVRSLGTFPAGCPVRHSA